MEIGLLCYPWELVLLFFEIVNLFIEYLRPLEIHYNYLIGRGFFPKGRSTYIKMAEIIVFMFSFLDEMSYY